jgi:hypothetical protein
MKKFYGLLLFLFVYLATGNATQLTGTLQKPDGTGFTGTLYLSIAQQVGITSMNSCGGPVLVTPTVSIGITITNGVMQSPPNVYGAECTLPSGMPYNAILKDQNGNTMFSTQWLITGNTQDVGTVYQGPAQLPPSALILQYGIGPPPTSTPCAATTAYVQADAAAGANLFLCINNVFVLQGSGVAGGISILAPVAGGTSNAVLFVGPDGKLHQDTGSFLYDSSTHALSAQRINASAGFYGSLIGNAATATALASIPGTCGTGQAPRGVDVQGNALFCFTPASGGGASIPSTLNIIKGSGSGNGADSGIPVSSVALNNANNTFTAPQTFGVGSISYNNQIVIPSTAATSGANINSPLFLTAGNYWTGTVSGTDQWYWQTVLGTGANPSSTYTLGHNGSSGTQSLYLPYMVQAGNAKQLTIDTAGNVVAPSVSLTGLVTSTDPLCIGAAGLIIQSGCSGGGGGITPVGAAYATQLRGATTGTLTPGIAYDSTGLNALNASASIAVSANYSDPVRANDIYVQQYPYQEYQFSDFRNSYNDFILTRSIEAHGTSGISDYLDQPSGYGNFNNLTGLQVSIVTQTPYQIGGGEVLNIDQHASDDAVGSNHNVNCVGVSNRFNEGCEPLRWFYQFSEIPFGGTIASASADSLGNPIYQITQTSGYSVASSGEQRIIYNHQGASAPAGDIVGVNLNYTDAGGKIRFPEITVSADHGLGTSTITTLIGGADYKEYDTSGGTCPYPVIASTWPGNIDPYSSPGVVDGSATKTQHQCLEVASLSGLSTGDRISLWDIGVNYENTIIQGTYTSAGHFYIKANLQRPHLPATLVVKGGGTGWGWQGQVDYAKTKYLWPIVATLDSTHILLWAGSDVTDGPKLNSYVYPRTTPVTPLTVTPTVVGGVVTGITTNASDYSLPGTLTLTKFFPRPDLTLGGGSCGVPPTFTWQFAPSQGRYTPVLATGGSTCPPGLTITAQSYYANPYYVWPVTRTARVIDPTLWATLDKNSTKAQRLAPSTSGYIVTDPWPATAAGVGNTLEIAPNFNRVMGSQVTMEMEEAASRKNTSDTWSAHVTSADPVRAAINDAPAYLFIGRARNNYMAGPASAPACPDIDDNNPTAGLCHSPTDNQFFPGPSWGGFGIQSRGYYLNFPPVFDTSGSALGASLYVDCAADPAHPMIWHPCQRGIASRYYSHFDKFSGSGMIYDQTDKSYTASGDIRSVQGGFTAVDEAPGYQITKRTGGSTHWSRMFDAPFTSFGSDLGQSDNTVSAGQYSAGVIAAGTGTPIAPLLFNVGTTGSTTYTYVITALTANGESVPGPPFSVTNGPASSPHIVVKGTAIPGATGYNIYRTAGPGGSGIICTNIAPRNVGTGDITLVCNDIGQAAGASAPSTNTTGLFILSNKSVTAIQGAGTSLASTTGTFTNGNLRGTNATGDEVDVPINTFCQSSGANCPASSGTPSSPGIQTWTGSAWSLATGANVASLFSGTGPCYLNNSGTCDNPTLHLPTSYVQRGQTSAISTTTIYTAPATALYRIAIGVTCDVASSGSTVSANLLFTDISGTSQNLGLGTAICTTLGLASFADQFPVVNLQSGSAVQIQTSIGNTPTYDIAATVEQMTIN